MAKAKKACKEGKMRNPATGRCVSVCKTGYKRYADFSKGNCKKLCKDNQQRNATTGRCRNIQRY